MSRSIIITLPHELGAQEAKRRIVVGLEQLQQEFVGKLAHSEARWDGDRADIRVIALGQTVTAQLLVLADALRIEVHLPWLLAALGSQVQSYLTTNTKDLLRIGPPPKKP